MNLRETHYQEKKNKSTEKPRRDGQDTRVPACLIINGLLFWCTQLLSQKLASKDWRIFSTNAKQKLPCATINVYSALALVNPENGVAYNLGQNIVFVSKIYMNFVFCP
jgi:hypothetical protein